MKTVKRPGVVAVALSENRKLGFASCTYVAQQSCPRCKFKNTACYAEHGHCGIITRRLNAEAEAARLRPRRLAENEAEALGELAPLLDLRLHVVGDCRTAESARVVTRACDKWVDNGRSPWAYTHAPQSARSDWSGVSTLASVETLAGIRHAKRRGFVPALTVERFPARSFRAGGVKFIACPYQTRGTDCVTCRLCLDDDRLRRKGLGISFAVHGPAAKRISLPVLEGVAA